MMCVGTGIKVSICFIMAHWTGEEFPVFLFYSLAAPVGEPLPLCATTRAVLAGAMRVDFYGDGAISKRFFFRFVANLPTNLIGQLTIESACFVFSSRFDRTQSLKKQDTAGILSAYLGNRP